jgi:hypothetical protein
MPPLRGLNCRTSVAGMKTTLKCPVWTSEKFAPEITLPFLGINPGRARSGKQTDPKLMKYDTMKMNSYPKSNSIPNYPGFANSGTFCSSMAHPGILPARRVMIFLGWLRLYQTILTKKSRTCRAKVSRD